MAWLDDNPPARSQFRRTRREEVSGCCVIHTAENAPDFSPPDTGAERVSNFIRTRSTPGSYHDLCDSDSTVNLVRYSDEAYQDGTGSNPHALSISAATSAHLWPSKPQWWRDGCIRQMAAAAARQSRYVKVRRGFYIPARRITREQSERRQPGFISHAERDPARRSDPGRDFPWAQFFAEYSKLISPLTTSPPAPEPVEPEDDDMLHIIQAQGEKAIYLSTNLVDKRHARTPAQIAEAIFLTAAAGGKVSMRSGNRPHVLPKSSVDSIPTVGGEGPRDHAIELRAVDIRSALDELIEAVALLGEKE